MRHRAWPAGPELGQNVTGCAKDTLSLCTSRIFLACAEMMALPMFLLWARKGIVFLPLVLPK